MNGRGRSGIGTIGGVGTLTALLMLSACAGGGYRPVRDLPVRIGAPYAVKGITYVPAADPRYDFLGYASWYGHESGSRTANGERFRPAWLTAAHTTLPLPSYVEVTALDSGRTILVRINDRGPFAAPDRARIIDLSRGAAEQLGMRGQGHVPVRVRVVDPTERDRALLRNGKAAAVRPTVPEKMLQNLRAQMRAAGL